MYFKYIAMLSIICFVGCYSDSDIKNQIAIKTLGDIYIAQQIKYNLDKSFGSFRELKLPQQSIVDHDWVLQCGGFLFYLYVLDCDHKAQKNDKWFCFCKHRGIIVSSKHYLLVSSGVIYEISNDITNKYKIESREEIGNLSNYLLENKIGLIEITNLENR